MKNIKHIFAVIMLCVIVGGCHPRLKENTACFRTQCYAVELAISEEEKRRGLQHRDMLEKNKGMLFAFPGNAPQKFWMKETLIPLDMLWLDYDGKIIYIEHDAPPCEKDPCAVYGPNIPISYVLEVNAGEAVRQDMRVGDRIAIDLKNVK